MRRAATCVVVAALVPIYIACKKADDEQPPAQQPYGQQPTYGQPPNYGTPQAQPTVQPAPAQPAPAQPAAAPASTLSQPGPAALPCQTDQTCVFARCNTAFGKCVFPCQNDNDCIPPNACVQGTGLCVPALGGMGDAGAS
jgi:hypothetical protein